MKYEEIKQLIDAIDNSKLSSLELDFPDGIKIKMEKTNNTYNTDSKLINNTNVNTDSIDKQNIQNIQNTNIKNNSNNNKIEEKEEGNIIKSPMVGTFYLKPSPNAKPYVEEGTKIKKGQVIGIIEAMKLMNEIESEYSGTIDKIFVKDGQAIEYGEPLFRII